MPLVRFHRVSLDGKLLHRYARGCGQSRIHREAHATQLLSQCEKAPHCRVPNPTIARSKRGDRPAGSAPHDLRSPHLRGRTCEVPAGLSSNHKGPRGDRHDRSKNGPRMLGNWAPMWCWTSPGRNSQLHLAAASRCEPCSADCHQDGSRAKGTVPDRSRNVLETIASTQPRSHSHRSSADMSSPCVDLHGVATRIGHSTSAPLARAPHLMPATHLQLSCGMPTLPFEHEMCLEIRL